MAEDILDVPQGRFLVRRPDFDPRSPLRAWDAADEYVLAHLHGAGIGRAGLVVVDDAFGALGVALHRHRPQSWSDSLLAHRAAAANLEANDLSVLAVDAVPSTEVPVGPVRTLVVKVPKAIAVLEDRLLRIRPLLSRDTVVVGAGMTRHIHTSTIDAFQRLIGPTTTSLARKKARLLFASVDPDRSPPHDPGPHRWTAPSGIRIVGLPDVFGATQVDWGTHLLLDHLPALAPGATVVDLACGTGIVGAHALGAEPSISLTCTDISYAAIASASATIGADRAAFHLTDACSTVETGTVDHVLVNPPFHDGHAVTDATAHRLFLDAHRVLRPGGRLTVVGNRHLGHHRTLRREFGNSEVVASGPRFVVLAAERN